MLSVFHPSLSLAVQLNSGNPLITVIPILEGKVMLHKGTVNVNIRLASASFENCS